MCGGRAHGGPCRAVLAASSFTGQQVRNPGEERSDPMLSDDALMSAATTVQWPRMGSPHGVATRRDQVPCSPVCARDGLAASSRAPAYKRGAHAPRTDDMMQRMRTASRREPAPMRRPPGGLPRLPPRCPLPPRRMVWRNRRFGPRGWPRARAAVWSAPGVRGAVLLPGEDVATGSRPCDLPLTRRSTACSPATGMLSVGRTRSSMPARTCAPGSRPSRRGSAPSMRWVLVHMIEETAGMPARRHPSGADRGATGR